MDVIPANECKRSYSSIKDPKIRSSIRPDSMICASSSGEDDGDTCSVRFCVFINEPAIFSNVSEFYHIRHAFQSAKSSLSGKFSRLVAIRNERFFTERIKLCRSTI